MSCVGDGFDVRLRVDALSFPPPPTAVLQALAALLLLREGGVFVCKLFECWTQSTAALVYLLHRKFRRIAIVKPITR